MRKIAFPVFVAVVGTVALNAFAFGTSSGASVAPVSGVLYRDLNNNGRREAAEPGIPGVVVASTDRSTVTNRAGKWSLDVAEGDRLTVQTGWYRSQCDQLTCAAGPGPDQDFGVRYQAITVKVRDGKNRFDVGLLPDWKGGYPIPSTRPIRANRKDVSARISFVKPTSGAGESNCYRTDTAAHRACQVGDRPTFLVQIYNEGTTAITRPGGHLELPAGTRLLSLLPSSLTNHPGLGTASHGEMDPATRRITVQDQRHAAPRRHGRLRTLARRRAGRPDHAEAADQGRLPERSRCPHHDRAQGRRGSVGASRTP